MSTDEPARAAGYQGLLFVLQTVGVAAGGVFLLVIAAVHNVRLDLTPERSASLTEPTRAVIARLDQDVTITVFYDSQAVAVRREMADLLERYDWASPKIRVQLRDLDRSPGLAKQLGVTRYNNGVVAGDRQIPLGLVDEAEITGALLRLIDPLERAVYFTVGHGEHDPTDSHDRHGYSQIARALEAEHYTVRRLEALGVSGVPGDAAVVIVGGPRLRFTTAELVALRRYVAGGGGVLFLLDPGTPQELAALLVEYGLHLSDDVVVDERNSLLGTDSLMPRIPYFNHSVFPDPPELPAVFVEAQSVSLRDEPPDIERTYLASSAEESWADSDKGSLTDDTPRFARGVDHAGPVPVAALARPAQGGKQGRSGDVVVIGDADFATNLHLGLMGNSQFFLAIIDLVTRRELHGVLRPIDPGGSLSTVTLTARQGTFVFWATVVAPPALVIVVGALAALQRRRRLR